MITFRLLDTYSYLGILMLTVYQPENQTASLQGHLCFYEQIEACKMTVNKYIDERSMQDDCCLQIYSLKMYVLKLQSCIWQIHFKFLNRILIGFIFMINWLYDTDLIMHQTNQYQYALIDLILGKKTYFVNCQTGPLFMHRSHNKSKSFNVCLI